MSTSNKSPRKGLIRQGLSVPVPSGDRAAFYVGDVEKFTGHARGWLQQRDTEMAGASLEAAIRAAKRAIAYLRTGREQFQSADYQRRGGRAKTAVSRRRAA